MLFGSALAISIRFWQAKELEQKLQKKEEQKLKQQAEKERVKEEKKRKAAEDKKEVAAKKAKAGPSISILYYTLKN